mgnify:CR=1 FL=1
MKIDKSYKTQGNYMDTSVYKNRDEKKKDMNIREDIGADIQISKSAKELVRQISQSEDTHFSEKVERIRKSILHGKYQVDPEKIADKILESIELQEGSDI